MVMAKAQIKSLLPLIKMCQLLKVQLTNLDAYVQLFFWSYTF